jgi:hypothetical protein
MFEGHNGTHIHDHDGKSGKWSKGKRSKDGLEKVRDQNVRFINCGTKMKT